MLFIVVFLLLPYGE